VEDTPVNAITDLHLMAPPMGLEVSQIEKVDLVNHLDLVQVDRDLLIMDLEVNKTEEDQTLEVVIQAPAH